MTKLYQFNRALGTYRLLAESDDEQELRTKVNVSRLENLRSFVVFELHRADGTREEIARGMAG